MLEEAKKFTKEHHMIEEGSRVIAGVSGGADSVCLLLLLLELQKEMTFELRVVHVEHGIRGQESLADCEFVEKMCGRLGVECKSHHIDVPEEAKQCRRTLEEMAQGTIQRRQSGRSQLPITAEMMRRQCCFI